jgi:hypothetical protein
VLYQLSYLGTLRKGPATGALFARRL